jgi:hypothetical protein
MSSPAMLGNLCTSSPAMLGKGSRSELTWRVDKRHGRAVARAELVEMLHFEQWGRHSAGVARPISKSWVSRNSLSRILLADLSISPWFGPQQAIGCCEWLRLNSRFNCGRPLWHVEKNWKKTGCPSCLEGVILTYVIRVQHKMACRNRYLKWLEDGRMTPSGYPTFNSYIENLRFLELWHLWRFIMGCTCVAFVIFRGLPRYVGLQHWEHCME